MGPVWSIMQSSRNTMLRAAKSGSGSLIFTFVWSWTGGWNGSESLKLCGEIRSTHICLYRPDSCASGAWSRIATCLAAGSLCRNWTLTLSSVRNFPLTSWRRNVKASRNHTCVLGTFTKSSARFPPSRLMLIASLGHRSSSARALHNTWSLWPAKGRRCDLCSHPGDSWWLGDAHWSLCVRID